MTENTTTQNREKKKKIAHILAGLVILVHGYEKFTSGHGSWLFFIFSGLVFLGFALLHHQLSKKMPWIDGVFFIIEGLLSFTVAYDYFHMGKKALPWCYLAVGIAQIVIAVVVSRKASRSHAAH